MRNYVMTRTNFVIIALIAAFTICLALMASQAQAQESDEVEYEFSFALAEGESSTERQDRLADEVGDYCENLTSSTSGLYASECEEEITTAVNDQIEESAEARFASR